MNIKNVFNAKTLLILVGCVAVVTVAALVLVSSFGGESGGGVTDTESTRFSTTTEEGGQPTKTTAKESDNNAISDDVLVRFIGKTVGDVKAEYGTSCTYSGFQGSSLMTYEDLKIAFLLDGYYNKPANHVKINYAISYGDKEIVSGLNGAMTYPQIVKAVGSSVKMGKPQRWYNEMDGVEEISLDFTYGEYTIYFEWTTDPNKNPSTVAMAYKRVNQTTSSVTTTTKLTPVTTKTSNDVAELEKRITAYLKKTYFYEKDLTVLGVSVYADSGKILTLEYKTDALYSSHIGVDYHKATGMVELYDTGELKFRGTLPK